MINKHTCEFVKASDIYFEVPDSLIDTFWEIISSDAPFSWGDNNRTLIAACRFLDHCKACFDKRLREHYHVKDEDWEKFCNVLLELGNTYIDLEN